MPEVLTLIARCGRAAVTWQTGKLGVIWDAEGRPATALVTPGNIVAGSFRVDYAAGQAADEIAVRYIEPDLDWQFNTLRRTVPDAGAQPASHGDDHAARRHRPRTGGDRLQPASRAPGSTTARPAHVGDGGGRAFARPAATW